MNERNPLESIAMDAVEQGRSEWDLILDLRSQGFSESFVQRALRIYRAHVAPVTDWDLTQR